MGSCKVVPNYRMEEIRRMNQHMEEVSEVWEEEFIRRAKALSVPYDKLSKIIRESVSEAVAQKKKKRQRLYVWGGLTGIAMCLVCVWVKGKHPHRKRMTWCRK